MDGKRVSATAVATNSLISCGNSTLSIPVGRAGRAHCTPSWGRRVQRRGAVDGPAQGRRRDRGILFLTAALPLLIGVGLAVVTGMWMFLAFTAVSAVSVLVPMLAGRRQRRGLRGVVAAAVKKTGNDDGGPHRPPLSLSSGAARGTRGTGRRPNGRRKEQGRHRTILRRLAASAWRNSRPTSRLEPDQPGFEPPGSGRPLPFILQLSVISVRGPEPEVAGLVRFILMQLTGYPMARGRGSCCMDRPESLPLTSRFLPGVSLHSTIPEDPGRAGRASTGAGSVPACSYCIDERRRRPGMAGIIAAARGRGWRVSIDCTRDGSAEAGQSSNLAERGPALCRGPRMTSLPTWFPPGVRPVLPGHGAGP